MGEIVNLVERASPRPGIVRFETNRVLSGTGHDRFVAGEEVIGNRPVDELARRLFASGRVAAVHVNGGVVTVDLAKGRDAWGLADIIRGLYTFYDDTPAAAGDAGEVGASDEAAAEQARAQVPEGHAEQAAEPVVTEEPAQEA